MKKISLLIIIGVFVQLHLVAQELIIEGTVTEKKSGEGMPFVNVFFKNTQTGAITDVMGNYRIKTRNPTDSLSASFIGFISLTKHVPQRQGTIKIDFELEENVISLQEVKFVAPENPAYQIIRNVVKNKKKNDPARHKNYSVEIYSNLKLGAADVVKEESIFRKHESAMIAQDDGSGRYYVPFLIDERLYHSEVVNNKKTNYQKSSIDKGVNVLKQLNLEQFTNGLDERANFYQDFILQFDKRFASPLATGALRIYEYYIIDSTKVNGKWQYRLSFEGRNSKAAAFKGEVVILKDSWAVSSITAVLPRSTNVNFLNEFKLHYEFKEIEKGVFFFSKIDIDARFRYNKGSEDDKNLTTLRLQKTLLYNDVKIGKNIAPAPLRLKGKEGKKLKEANKLKLIDYRKVVIGDQPDKESQAIDSLNTIPFVKIFQKLTDMGLTGYYSLGKIGIGPYLELYRKNRVEGSRVTLGFRTNENISEFHYLEGKMGYGFRDKKVKYKVQGGWRLDKRYRELFNVSYESDLTILGTNLHETLLRENKILSGSDNFFVTVSMRKQQEEFVHRNRWDVFYEKEWVRGISTKVSVVSENIFSGEFVPFFDKNDKLIPNFTNRSLSLQIRLSKDERLIDNYFRRLYAGTRFPILNILATQGQYKLNSTGDKSSAYTKLLLTIKHKIDFGLVRLKYAVEIGKIFGYVPFHLLEIHRGNNSFLGYSRYRFNLITPGTIASDQYMVMNNEYHLNGFIMNRIPLLRKLNLRVVLSSKFVVGSLSSRHENVMKFPLLLAPAPKPYLELGAGLENIFKAFRIEAVWRTYPAKLPGQPDFGIRIINQIGL